MPSLKRDLMGQKQSDDQTRWKQTSRLVRLIWKRKWRNLSVVNIHHKLVSGLTLTDCTFCVQCGIIECAHFQFDLQMKWWWVPRHVEKTQVALNQNYPLTLLFWLMMQDQTVSFLLFSFFLPSSFLIFPPLTPFFFSVPHLPWPAPKTPLYWFSSSPPPHWSSRTLYPASGEEEGRET